MILFSLLLAGQDDDTVPPRRPVPISISALANRFGISRVHVRTVLRDAETQGLIERTGKDGSQVLFRPGLAAAVETYFAAMFLFTAHCALQAAATRRLVDRPRRCGRRHPHTPSAKAAALVSRTAGNAPAD